ncbi:MAG: ABC transporter ATP-binding protein, partial [Bacteroidota bacterium]
MNSFWRLLGYLKGFKALAVGNVVFNLLAVVLSIFSLVMIIPFLELLFDQKELIVEEPAPLSFSAASVKAWFDYYTSTLIVEQGKHAALFFVCILISVVFFFKNLFRYLAVVLITPIRTGITFAIRQNLFKRLLQLPLAYFSDEHKGDLMSRMTVDVLEVERSILNVIGVMVKEPLTIIGSLAAMLLISTELTLFVFLLIGLVGFIIGRIGKSLKRRSSKAQRQQGKLLSTLDETISGLRIIKAFNAEDRQAQRYEAQNDSYRNIMNRIFWRRDLSSPLTEYLGVSVVALLLGYGGNLVLQGDLKPETFIGFVALFYNVIAPAKSFSNAYYNIQKGIAASERIDELLDEQAQITEQAEPVILNSFQEGIQFENVGFEYEEGFPVLRSVNLNIKKGQTVALVGNSGSGKSTLADLIPRFHDPTKGRILLDGVNLKSYQLKALRDRIGIVCQHPVLFHDSIFENIAFGSPAATAEQVVQAAKAAFAHEFIEQLPDGYATIIGDQGHKLSGGQRQRITLARALLNNPEILILDEATSSLDSASEKQVQLALKNLMQDRTALVIAHRLST